MTELEQVKEQLRQALLREQSLKDGHNDIRLVLQENAHLRFENKRLNDKLKGMKA